MEFIRGFRALHVVGPCVTVFGSARFKEDHPSQAMPPVAKLATVTPGDELLVAVRAMDETGAGQLPVLEDGRLVGAMGREQVLRYIAARAKLGV